MRNTVFALTVMAAAAVATAEPRDVQIKSVDFTTGVVELHNFGTDNIPLDAWRFCTHDFNQARIYSGSTNLNGVTIEGGTSVFVHTSGDAPGGDPDRVNSSPFAAPLGSGPYGMQIYHPNTSGFVSFGDSTLIADHLQWSDDEVVGSAEFRTGQAVGQGLWSSAGAFIITLPGSTGIELNDLTNGRDHAPSDYTVLEDTGACNPADLSEPFGSIEIGDLLTYLGFFFSDAAEADIDGNAGVTIGDLLFFLSFFFSGC